MDEKVCSGCGYGIMERVVKVDVVGGWGSNSGAELETEQKQTDWWRCIDCLFEEPVETGDGSKG